MIRKIFPFLGGVRVSVWQHRNVEPAFWHFGAAAAEESYGIIPIPFRVVATIAYGVSFSIFFASAQSEQVRLCTRLSENVFPDCPKNGSPQLPDTGICSVRKSSHASFAGYGRRCDSEKDSPESYSR